MVADYLKSETDKHVLYRVTPIYDGENLVASGVLMEARSVEDSGAELELSVFADLAVVAIGAVYIISRSVGKYFGAGISARMTRCDKHIVDYLGITLLPQAGVALGMAIQAMRLGVDGNIVRILFHYRAP